MLFILTANLFVLSSLFSEMIYTQFYIQSSKEAATENKVGSCLPIHDTVSTSYVKDKD